MVKGFEFVCLYVCMHACTKGIFKIVFFVLEMRKSIFGEALTGFLVNELKYFWMEKLKWLKRNACSCHACNLHEEYMHKFQSDLIEIEGCMTFFSKFEVLYWSECITVCRILKIWWSIKGACITFFFKFWTTCKFLSCMHN